MRSPLTFQAPDIVSRQLGKPIRWLVGTDSLSRKRVLLDWSGRRAVVGGPKLRGEAIRLIPHAGLFQVEIASDAGRSLAFLDSGAQLSYAPPASVSGMSPVGHQRDFYPVFGEFDVPVNELAIRVGSRRIRGRFGVLPPLLGAALAEVGGTGWILGSDFFRDRAIQLDLANHQVIDATVELPRQRTTARPHGHTTRAGGLGITGSVRGIEGWRGWRLADVHGTPRLRSLTAPAIWDRPSFTADTLPNELQQRRDAGIHAYATPGQLRALSYGPALVYGQVALHGQVCVHEMGYRAEHCRIERLFLSACGRHAPTPASSTGLLLLDAITPPEAGKYCGCGLLEPHEWLSYLQLEELAASLATRYECEVIIDAERPRRHSPCDASRSRRRAGARSA